MLHHLRNTLVLGAIATAFLPGCQEDHYEIEMVSKDGRLQRTLTCYRQDIETREDGATTRKYVEFPPEELGRIAKIYQRRLETDDPNVHKFEGSFEGNTPQDVGGSGFYVRLDSEMGSGGVYLERFRGNDDLLDQIERSTKAADRLINLLIGWFESEIRPYGTPRKYRPLLKFFNRELRRDFKNAGLYCWAHRLKETDETGKNEEALMRLILYFVERGYFEPLEMPILYRAWEDFLEEDNRDLFVLLLRRVVASQGAPEEDRPLDEPLAFLGTGETLTSSLREYLRTTREFRALVNQWNKKKRQDRPAEPPEPEEVLRPLIDDLFLAQKGGGARLSVSLVLPARPVFTNARSSKDKPGSLSWSAQVGDRPRKGAGSLPVVCYAFWSLPDRRFQEEHFGKIVLKGEDLGSHCLWRGALDEEEADEWSQFLADLSPGKTLIDRLRAFRFTREGPAAKPSEEPPSAPTHAEETISAIIQSLERKEQ